MSVPDNLLYEYAVIRYVPRVDREEFINIGLIMMSKRNRWIKAMVLLDEERIKAIYPKADIDCLHNQSRLFENPDVPEASLPVEEKYRWLTAVKSACLQVSPSHPGILSYAYTHETTTFSVTEGSFDCDNVSAAISVINLLEEEFTRLFSSLIL